MSIIDGQEMSGIQNLSRRPLIRSMRNPMDKCTIVSILKKDIREVKFTIEPGIFNLPAGSYENPSVLVVGGSSWWRDVDIEQPLLEIPVSSIQIAESIVKDYCNGMLGCDMSDAMPGLFYVQGPATAAEIKLKYKAKLDEVKAKQNNWFTNLVRLADSLWARSNGNPLTISDEMRLAAESQSLKDKPWMQDFKTIQLVNCKGCGALRNPMYPVCPQCKLIDSDHPDAGNLKFAL